MSRRLLGLFAHPDDESFLCGGSLARYARAGVEILIVSATRGELGPTAAPGIATREELAAVRTRELESAARLLGVRDVMVVDYPDGELQALGPAVLEELFFDVTRSFQPHVVVTFGADGLYHHPDHLAVHRSASAAFVRVRRLGGRSGSLPAKLYYGCWPQQHLRGAIRALEAQHIATTFIPAPRQCGSPDSMVTTVIDVDGELPSKVAAIRAHASQVEAAFHSVEPNAFRELWGKEFFVRAYPSPWVTGVIGRDRLTARLHVPRALALSKAAHERAPFTVLRALEYFCSHCFDGITAAVSRPGPSAPWPASLPLPSDPSSRGRGATVL